MKNRYVKHTHISEHKFHQILKLFYADLTSTQVAETVKINRNTISRIFQLLRARMVELAKEESYFEEGEIEINESSFGVRRVRGRRGKGAEKKQKLSFRSEEA